MEYLIKLKVKVEREARRFILFVVFERGVIDRNTYLCWYVYSLYTGNGISQPLTQATNPELAVCS